MWNNGKGAKARNMVGPPASWQVRNYSGGEEVGPSWQACCAQLDSYGYRVTRASKLRRQKKSKKQEEFPPKPRISRLCLSLSLSISLKTIGFSEDSGTLFTYLISGFHGAEPNACKPRALRHYIFVMFEFIISSRVGTAFRRKDPLKLGLPEGL